LLLYERDSLWLKKYYTVRLFSAASASRIPVFTKTGFKLRGFPFWDERDCVTVEEDLITAQHEHCEIVYMH